MTALQTLIVAGVSSAGKSTFIAGDLPRILNRSGIVLCAQTSLHFAGKLVKAHGLRTPTPSAIDLGNKPVRILHYNLLMPIEADPTSTLQTEPLLNTLAKLDLRYQLYLCYAPDAIIRARMAARTQIEPALAPDQTAYPKDRFTACFDSVDQRQLVLTFADMLEHRCDTIKVVYSNARATTLLDWEAFREAPQSEALEAALVT